MGQFLSIALAVLLSVIATDSSYAALAGSTVNVSAYFPSASALRADPGDVVVSGEVEYAAGAYSIYNQSWEIDISDTQLTITDAMSVGFPFAVNVPGAFNGWILRVISGPEITSAEVDPASEFSPIALSVIGGDLYLNFIGVSGSAGSSSTISFTTAPIPEPSSALMLSLGLFGLGALRRLAVGRGCVVAESRVL